MSVTAVRVWIFLATTNVVASHAQQELRKNQNRSSEHDLHHERVKGNYGVNGSLWDLVGGTRIAED